MKKVCSKCKQEKNLSEFRKDRTQKDGHQPSCKVCARAYHKGAYQTKYGEKSNERNRLTREANREKLDDYKKQKKCHFCDENEPICLDLHHKDPTEKEFTMWRHATRSWTRLLKRVEICIVVCSNCPRILHAEILRLDGGC